MANDTSVHKSQTQLLFAFMAIASIAVTAFAQADALLTAGLGDVRLDGRVGAKLARCIEARVYSDWANGVMYEEAVNAFRTHADDKGVNGGWQNEYWGKTMLCTAGAVAYTGDAALKAKTLERAHAFIDEFQKPNGYLSTYAKEDFLGGATNGYGKWCFNIWGRKYTFWALIELHRATGDGKCLDAAVKMADHLIAQLERLETPIWKTGAGPWHGTSSMSILRPMNELYRLTGDGKYKDFAEGIVNAMFDKSLSEGALLANASRKEPVRDWFPCPGTWAKAYEEMSCLEGAADFSRFGTDGRTLHAVEAFCRHLCAEEINPMRSAGHFDHFFGGGVTFNGMTELCDVVHWIRLVREMLLLTGKAEYADLMEEAFYNAFLAGVSRDGRWGAHVVRSHGTRHLWAPAQTGMTEHQCCPDNMMRAYFSLAQTLAARASGGAVAVIHYADGETRLPGATVRVTGGYPYSDGDVAVSVASEKAGKVRFRVPVWSRGRFLVDGKMSGSADGWCEREFPAGGAAFHLRFDYSPRICDVPADRERESNGRLYADNPHEYTQHWMKALTPDMVGLARTEPASFVMRGPLVLAKGRFAGTTRDETLFASAIRGQGKRAGEEGWVAELTRIPVGAASAGVEDVWRLVLRRGRERIEANVSDFASVSDVDDPSNWFSLWF